MSLAFEYAQPVTQAYADLQYIAMPVAPYVSTQTYISSCGGEEESGLADIIVTRSAYSFTSQNDADTQAMDAAEFVALAMRSLNPCPEEI